MDVHTHNVESFNNMLKYKIKNMKGLAEAGWSPFNEFLFPDLFKDHAFEEC